MNSVDCLFPCENCTDVVHKTKEKCTIVVQFNGFFCFATFKM